MVNNLEIDEKNNELLIKYHNSKDRKYYDELFLNNVNLVRYFISKYIKSTRLSKKELIEEYFSVGCIGLHNAIINNDIEKLGQFPFTAFALKCIRNAIYNEIKKVTKQEDHISLNGKLNDDSEEELIDFISDDENGFDEEVEEKVYAEYTNKKIKNAINKLDKKSKEIVELSYGFNNKERMTTKEISIKLGIPLIEVNKILLSVRDTLVQELIEFKQEYFLESDTIVRVNKLYLKYGKEKVNSVINSLNEKSKLMLKFNCGIDIEREFTISEIAQIFDSSVSIAKTIIYNSLDRIEKILNNPDLIDKVIENNRLTNIYSKYKKEKVEEVINSLSKKTQKIIKLYYGLENNKKMTAKEIADILKCSPSYVVLSIYRVLNGIEKKLEVSKSIPNDRLVRLYSKYGKKEVDLTINCLNEKTQKMIKLYYGLEIDRRMSATGIAEIFDYNSHNVTSIIGYALTKIEKILEYPDLIGRVRYNDKLTRLYLKYGKEKVDEVINSLSEREQRIIKLYFGLDNRRIKVREIAEIFNCSNSSVFGVVNRALEKIEKKLENPDSIYYIRVSYNDRLARLYSKYGKEKVNESIDLLTQKAKKMLKLYFGLEMDTKMTTTEISEIFNCSITNVTSTIYNAFNTLEKKLDNPRGIMELYSKYGKEKVDALINGLDKKKQLTLRAYYREDGKKVTLAQIAEDLGYTFNFVRNTIYSSIKSIENKLIKDSKKNSSKESKKY